MSAILPPDGMKALMADLAAAKTDAERVTLLSIAMQALVDELYQDPKDQS